MTYLLQIINTIVDLLCTVDAPLLIFLRIISQIGAKILEFK